MESTDLHDHHKRGLSSLTNLLTVVLPLSLLVIAATQAVSLPLNAYLMVVASKINPSEFSILVAPWIGTCKIGCTKRERERESTFRYQIPKFYIHLMRKDPYSNWCQHGVKIQNLREMQTCSRIYIKILILIPAVAWIQYKRKKISSMTYFSPKFSWDNHSEQFKQFMMNSWYYSVLHATTTTFLILLTH